MGGSPDPAPDYRGAAEETGISSQANTQQQTYANRPNQTYQGADGTVYGTVGWTATQAKDQFGNPILDASGRPVETWSQTTQLGDAATKSLNAQQDLTAGRSGLALGLYDRIGREQANAPDWNSFQQMGGAVGPQQLQTGFGPGYQTSIQGGQPYYQQAGDAYYKQATSRLDPQWQQREDAMRTQLANQGIDIGDKAYTQAMQDFNLGRNDAYGSASNQATMMAGQEAARMQGMDVQGAAFGNQALANQAAFGNQALGQQFGQNMSASQYASDIRARQIAEQLQKQGWSLNQANALLSGQQVSMPSFTPFSQASKADTTNYLGAAQSLGQYNLEANAQKNAFMGDIMSAVGGAASSAAMFSDERLKKNIHRLPFQVAPGVPLAQYEWKKGGGQEIGVIAQDVARSNPQAVSQDPSGFLKVDYEQVAPGLPFSVGGKKKGAKRG